jgi:hypothetical protein
MRLPTFMMGLRKNWVAVKMAMNRAWPGWPSILKQSCPKHTAVLPSCTVPSLMRLSSCRLRPPSERQLLAYPGLAQNLQPNNSLQCHWKVRWHYLKRRLVITRSQSRDSV